MEKIFEDENHNYQIDLSQAVWASDRLNSIYHESKIELSDVDFIAETKDDLLFIEYKNAKVANASKPLSFQPDLDKKISQVVRKYYDSFIYTSAMGIGNNKSKKFIYILEYPDGDSVTRRGIRNKLKTKLPFLFQELNEVIYKLIDEINVMSIKEWNEAYPDFPLLQTHE